MPHLFLGLISAEAIESGVEARMHLAQARQLANGDLKVLVPLTRALLSVGERQDALKTVTQILETEGVEDVQLFEVGVVLARFELYREAANDISASVFAR